MVLASSPMNEGLWWVGSLSIPTAIFASVGATIGYQLGRSPLMVIRRMRRTWPA